MSINKGAKMPAWFDLPPMGPEMFTKIDEKGIGASIAHVFDTIEKECASGTSIGRIVIGGFSQGGCLAIQTVLRCKYVRPLVVDSMALAPANLCSSQAPFHIRMLCLAIFVRMMRTYMFVAAVIRC